MKILMANKFFFPNGGSETVFFQERALLQKAGIETVDFSMQDDRNLPSPQSMHFVRKRDYKNGGTLAKIGDALAMMHSAEAVDKIAQLIHAERPDIVHCHNIYHQLTPSIIRAAKKLGVPVVLTLHDFKIVCPVYNRLSHGQACNACETGDFSNVVRKRCADGSLGKSLVLYAEAAVQRALGSYEAVDRFIAVSQFMADAVTRWRVPREKVTLLYNGVAVGNEQPPALESSDPYILYLGRLSPEKGLLTLGRAQQGSGVRIVIAGTGPLEATLRQEFPSLELIGHQSGTDLQKWVAEASAIVIPSQSHENCPMSVLEAMAAGKAVIGSRIGGIPELVVHEKTGLLFQPGDAMALRAALQRVQNHPAERATMGKQGFLTAREHFSLDQHYEGLLQIYRSVAPAAFTKTAGRT